MPIQDDTYSGDILSRVLDAQEPETPADLRRRLRQEVRDAGSQRGFGRMLERIVTRTTPIEFREGLLYNELGEKRTLDESLLPINDMIQQAARSKRLTSAAEAIMDGSATEEQTYLFEDYVDRAMRPRTTGGQTGEIMADSASFMVEAALTFGIGALGKRALLGGVLGKATATKTERLIADAAQRKIARDATAWTLANAPKKVAQGLGAAAIAGTTRALIGEGMRAPFGATRTEAGARRQMFQKTYDVREDEAGRIAIEYAENLPDFSKALLASGANVVLEWVTESLGEEFAKMPLLSQLDFLQTRMGKILPKRMQTRSVKLGLRENGTIADAVLFNGVAIEALEEYAGMGAKEAMSALGLAPDYAEEEWSEAWTTDLDDHLAMWMAFAATGGVIGAGQLGLDYIRSGPEAAKVKEGIEVEREKAKASGDIQQNDEAVLEGRAIETRKQERAEEGFAGLLAQVPPLEDERLARFREEAEEEAGPDATPADIVEAAEAKHAEFVAEAREAAPRSPEEVLPVLRAKMDAKNVDVPESLTVVPAETPEQTAVVEEGDGMGRRVFFAKDMPEQVRAVMLDPYTIVLSADLAAEENAPTTVDGYFLHEMWHSALALNPKLRTTVLGEIARDAPNAWKASMKLYEQMARGAGIDISHATLQEEGVALAIEGLSDMIRKVSTDRAALERLVQDAEQRSMLRKVLDALLDALRHMGLDVERSDIRKMREWLDGVGASLKTEELEEGLALSRAVSDLLFERQAEQPSTKETDKPSDKPSDKTPDKTEERPVVAAETGDKGGGTVTESVNEETEAPALGDIIGVEGAESELELPSGRSMPVRYVFVEAESLVPSHDARKGYIKNEHGDKNERDYGDPVEGKPYRENVEKIADSPKPALLLTDTPTATDGPPIVTPQGVVLGGNARAMAQQLIYHRGSDAASELRASTVSAAARFGAAAPAVQRLRSPVLVRVLSAADAGKPGAMSRELNVSLTTGKTPVTEAISRGSKIGQAEADQLAHIIGDGTVADLWSSPDKAAKVFRWLQQIGAFTEADAVGLRGPDGKPSKAGREVIEQTLLGSVVPDVRAMSSLTPSVRAKLIRALPSLVQLRSAHPEFIDILVGAIDGVQDVRATGLSFADALQQTAIIPEPWKANPVMRWMTSALLSDKQIAFARRMRRMSDDVASAASGQSDMFMSASDLTFDAIAERHLWGDTKFALSPPTDSAEFKAWFGDSKVVDENGEPLVAYKAMAGHEPSVDDSGVTYVALNRRYADRFADIGTYRNPKFRSVQDVYVRMENPFDYRVADHRHRFWEWFRADFWRKHETVPADHVLLEELSWGQYRLLEQAHVVEWIKGQGFDGMYVQEDPMPDRPTEDDVDEFHRLPNVGVFSPTQIKSADNTTYDPSNPDIRFALSEGPGIATGTVELTPAEDRFWAEMYGNDADRREMLEAGLSYRAGRLYTTSAPALEEYLLETLAHHQQDGEGGRLPPSFYRTDERWLASRIAPLGESAKFALRKVPALHQDLDALPDMKLGQQVERRIGDQYTRIRQLVDWLREVGVVTDETDTNGLIDLWDTKADGRFTRLNAPILKALDLVSKEGISIKEFVEYLIAAHAEERNQFFIEGSETYRKNLDVINDMRVYAESLEGKERDEAWKNHAAFQRENERWAKRVGMVESEDGKVIRPFDHDENAASGMTEKHATDVLKRWRKDNPKMKEAADMVALANHNALQEKIDAGLVSKKEGEALLDRWPHYVPLFESEVSDEYSSFTPGYSGFKLTGKELNLARGRRGGTWESIENPAASSQAQIRSSAVRIEKEAVNQSLWKLLAANRGIISYTEEERKDMDIPMPDHALTVHVNGKEILISVDPEIERAMSALGVDKMPEFVRKYISPITRYQAAVNVAWNLGFLFRNMFRDPGTAFVHLAKFDMKGLRREVIGWSFRHGIKGAWHSANGTDDANLSGAALDAKQWADRARAAGGLASRMMYETPEQTTKRIEREAERGNKPGMFRAIGDFMTTLNEGVEGSIRVSTFKALVGRGYTDQQAAVASKNITVNFGRKGEWGPMMNSLWLFSTANLGGLFTAKRALTGKGGDKVRGAAMQLAGVGFMLHIWNMLMGGDDDDGKPLYLREPDWNRESNFTIMLPDAGWGVKLPTPWIYNSTYNLGAYLADTIIFDGDAVSGAWHLALATLESNNPTGASPTFVHALAPTVVDPFLDVGMNTKFSGSPVHPEHRGFGAPPPASSMSFRSTPESLKWMASAINEMTGGDLGKSGFIDMHPEDIGHFAEFLYGGAGRFAERSARSLFGAMGLGETQQVKDTPIIRTFVAKAPDYMITSDFYTALEEIGTAKDNIKRHAALGHSDVVRRLRKEDGKVLALDRSANAARRRASDIRKRMYDTEPGKKREMYRAQLRRIEANMLRAFYKAKGLYQ